jgi:hypothetical protein
MNAYSHTPVSSLARLPISTTTCCGKVIQHKPTGALLGLVSTAAPDASVVC